MSMHPDIYFSVPKEPFFWASDYPRLREHYGFADLKTYEALFSSTAAREAKWRADGSTVYLYSESAVHDIVAAVPESRFIVGIRDPVDLVVSLHRTQLIALNDDEPDFMTAWRRSLSGQNPKTDPLDAKLVDYPRSGLLGKAVESVLELIPRERLFVQKLDDMREAPAAVWADLTRFLEITEEPLPSFEVYNLSRKMYRYPRVRRLTHRPPGILAVPMRGIRQWSRTTSMTTIARAKKRMWRPEQRPSITPGERDEVAMYFREDNIRLGDLLGIDTSGWCQATAL